MKKLDIMRKLQPGKWVIRDGKVQRIEEFIPTAVVVEKEEKLEVKEKLEEDEEIPKKKGKVFRSRIIKRSEK